MGGVKIDPADLPGIDGAVGAFIAHVRAPGRPGGRPAGLAATGQQLPVIAVAILENMMILCCRS